MSRLESINYHNEVSYLGDIFKFGVTLKSQNFKVYLFKMHRYETFEIKSERGRRKMEQIFLAAVAQSNVGTVELCLDKGVDPNVLTDDRAALHLATIKGDLHIGILLMCDRRTNLNLRSFIGLTPLMFACIYERRKFVQALLAAGALVNIVSDKGKSALHMACMNKNIGIVSDLVSNGANINVRDAFDNTPLSIVVSDYPSASVVRYLLRKGASATKIKQFPLFLECTLTCCTEKRLKVLQILVSYDIDVNWPHPISGMNCLHYTAMSGYEPAAEFLLKSGASLQHFDKSGRTPLDVAIQHENIGIVRLYREWMTHRRVFFAEAEDVLEDIRLLFKR